MKVLKEFKSFQVVEIELLELTLLSREEYDEYRHNIPLIDDYWWLRSPGYGQFTAANVCTDGSLGDIDVSYSYRFVRPALKFNAQNLRVADKFLLGGYSWTVIAEGIALCDKAFCHMAFRKGWDAPYANDYTHSDIKKYLDQQFERMKNVVVAE